MSLFSVPRFILSGTTQGVGKSLIGLGLAVALRKRGLSLSCCVIGPYMARATSFKRICGRFVYCLDERLLSRDQMNLCLYHASLGADLLLIEGTKGLYDGYHPGVWRGSDASIAELTKTPVVLLFDGRGLESSVAALIKGYTEFAKGFQLVGAIANRMPADTELRSYQRQFFDDALTETNLPPLVGCIPEFNAEEFLPNNQLNEQKNLALYNRQFLVDLANLVGSHVDLDKLISFANNAAQIKLENVKLRPESRRCKIAYSDDSAFNLGFQSNLALLNFFGGDTVAFSPVADISLPKGIGGLYITGGALKDYIEDLCRNTKMKGALKEFYDAGGVIYAEGSGAAFLCERIRYAGSDEYEGVGIIKGTAIYSSEGKFAYNESVTVEESILGRIGLIIKSVSTGEWSLSTDHPLVKTLRITRGVQSAILEGYSPGAQTLATFSFAHWGSNPLVAKNFVDAAAVVKKL